MRQLKALSPQMMAMGVFSPAVQLSKVFEFQSYFDSTLLQNAILEQNPNEPIVASTLLKSQLQGYAVGLHPSSQTPVAIQFDVAGQGGSSNTYTLKPGQVLRPTGVKEIENLGTFAGFRWGLPFGWLGGGLATLVVFQTPDSNVDWSAHTEIIFHRARYEVIQQSDVTAAANDDAPYNWPQRFPWPLAARGSAQLVQQGQPIIAIAEPTRALFVLRGISDLLSPAVSDARVRMIAQATNDVGLDSAGAAILTNPIFDEVVFPLFASIGTSGNLATQNGAVMYTGLLERIAADKGGVLFVDNSTPAGSLDGCFVDVVRYGKL